MQCGCSVIFGARAAAYNLLAMKTAMKNIVRTCLIAISFCREVARAINRLATFAHAMSNTPAVSAISTHNGFVRRGRK